MSGGVNKIGSSELTNLNQKISNIESSPNTNNVKPKINTLENSKKVSSQTKTLSPHELKIVINKINENVSKLNKDVKFAYNETLKSLIVKVIDTKTGKVIREIPPQEVINLQKKLSEVVGIIFDSKEVER